MRQFLRGSLFILLIAASFGPASAQTTAFTYQGRLTDSSMPRTAQYDFVFLVCGDISSSPCIGSPIFRPGVQVTTGIFKVELDFGASPFTSDAARYLEVHVRPGGSPVAYTPLSPRQPITSAPYAVKALNAANADTVGGTSSSGFVLKAGDSMTGPLNLPPNGLQVGTNQILTANGNVGIGISPASGTKLDVLQATGATAIKAEITVPNGIGLFANAPNGHSKGGVFLGGVNGIQASATNDADNVSAEGVFGSASGSAGTRIGVEGRASASAATLNQAIGVKGSATGPATNNYGVHGVASGGSNNVGIYGESIGGTNNWAAYLVGKSFIGGTLGVGVTQPVAFVQMSPWGGTFNSILFGDWNCGLGFAGIGFGTAVPSCNNYALSGTSSETLLNRPSGGLLHFRENNSNQMTIAAGGNVGIGTAAPSSLLTIGTPETTVNTGRVGIFNAGGLNLILRDTTNDVEGFFGANSGNGVFIGSSGAHNFALRTNSLARLTVEHTTGDVGIGTTNPAVKLDVEGDIRVGTSGVNGCIQNDAGAPIAGSCSSDLRFKKQVTPFGATLERVSRLRPVHYFWRSNEFPAKRFGDSQVYGLVAQEVEKVMPELVSIDENGYKMVDYSKLPLLTIQAVKDQQELIVDQKERIESLERQVAELKALVCSQTPAAQICKP